MTAMGFEQFSRLLTNARQRAGLTKAELADRLGIISRQSITNWEGVRPPKRGITPDEVNALSKALDVSVLDLVTALGYEVKFEGIADEAEAALLQAYQQLLPVQQQMLRAAAGLSSGSLPASELPSLRRLADTGSPGRPETQE